MVEDDIYATISFEGDFSDIDAGSYEFTVTIEERPGEAYSVVLDQATFVYTLTVLDPCQGSILQFNSMNIDENSEILLTVGEPT